MIIFLISFFYTVHSVAIHQTNELFTAIGQKVFKCQCPCEIPAKYLHEEIHCGHGSSGGNNTELAQYCACLANSCLCSQHDTPSIYKRSGSIASDCFKGSSSSGDGSHSSGIDTGAVKVLQDLRVIDAMPKFRDTVTELLSDPTKELNTDGAAILKTELTAPVDDFSQFESKLQDLPKEDLALMFTIDYLFYSGKRTTAISDTGEILSTKEAKSIQGFADALEKKYGKELFGTDNKPGDLQFIYNEKMVQAAKEVLPELKDLKIRHEKIGRPRLVKIAPDDQIVLIDFDDHFFLTYHAKVGNEDVIFLLDSMDDTDWKTIVASMLDVPETTTVYAYFTGQRQHSYTGCDIFSFQDAVTIKKFGEDKLLEYTKKMSNIITDDRKSNIKFVNSVPAEFYSYMQSISYLTTIDNFYRKITDPAHPMDIPQIIKESENLPLNHNQDNEIVNDVLRNFVANLHAIKDLAPDAQKPLFEANLMSLVTRSGETSLKVAEANYKVNTQNKFMPLVFSQMVLRLLNEP